MTDITMSEEEETEGGNDLGFAMPIFPIWSTCFATIRLGHHEEGWGTKNNS